MRILDVAPRPGHPPNRGSRVRMHNLLRNLAGANEVRQFSLWRAPCWPPSASIGEHRRGPYVEACYAHPLSTLGFALGRRLVGSEPVLSGAVLRAARPRRLAELLAWADATLVEDPWQFEHCRRSRRPGPLVLSTHNVQAVRFAAYARVAGAAPATRRALRLIERIEANAVERADLVLSVSSEDRAHLVERYSVDPRRVVEVPNGADPRLYAPVDPDGRARAKRRLGLPDRPTAVFVGGDIPPNRLALRWVRRLAERSARFTFLVVGPVARPARDGSLVAAGEVADVRPYLEAADLALCPTELGSGTKIKLFEALAAGLPAVVFAEALAGTALADGEHLLVVPKDERELLAALGRLVDEPELASGLGRAARSFVVANHDWATIALRLDAVLRDLTCAGGPAPASPAARGGSRTAPGLRTGR